MDEQRRLALREFYQQHLERMLLPFWLQHGVDHEYGGFFTCFDNRGERRVSTDKYTWSQGRFIWLLARLAEMAEKKLVNHDASALLQLAGDGVRFLASHAFLANGNCAYVLDQHGVPKEASPGAGYDSSFFADCFVVIGFAEYARVAGDQATLERAATLYDLIRARVQSPGLRSDPYPIPPGYAAHSVPMIMLNVGQVLSDAMDRHAHVRRQEIERHCEEYAHDIMSRFVRPDDLVAEMIPLQGQTTESVLCRHVAPGHAIESMWFVMTQARKSGQAGWLTQATRAVTKAFDVGWDQEYGGLLRYVDRNGGKPQGSVIGDPYEELMLDTWDTKLWWPHSEALYTTLLAYEVSADESFLTLYQRTHDYVFRTFPNPDQAIGEWIQIRDRRGDPIDKQVALPVKDPYHIIRNVLLIIELLR
ncbi:MAG: AGE family epimerase/isomerase [Herpetosiphon sp.]